jgi:hypothetical protein
MAKLKRCPLCGGEAIFDCVEPLTSILKPMCEVTYTVFISCCNCSCGISGDGSKTEEQAMESAAKKWNTRQDFGGKEGNKWT